MLDTAVVVVVVVVVIVGMVMIRGCNQHKANDTHMLAYNKITCSHLSSCAVNKQHRHLPSQPEMSLLNVDLDEQ